MDEQQQQKPAAMKLGLTVEDLCQGLGCDRKTLYALIKADPNFPCRKIGKAWRFSATGIDAWLASGRDGGRSKAKNVGQYENLIPDSDSDNDTDNDA